VVYRYLPIVALDAVSAARWQNVAVRNDSNERGQLFPDCRSKQTAGCHLAEKRLDLRLAMFNDPDFASCDEAPQIHEAIHGGIHLNKIGVNDRYGDFADVGTRPTSKKRRLRVSEVTFGEIRLAFQNRGNPHRLQICFAD
jgi:hypothetical protein